MAFYYKQEYCTGCRTCQMACKDKNNLPVGILFRRVRSFETGKYPKAGKYNFAETCNHCVSPACLAICPKKCFTIADDGTVQMDTATCNGCLLCVEACPYGIPKYFEANNRVYKCDACIELRALGEPPACVAACPMRALEFGDAAALKAAHSGETLVSELPCLPSASQTAPTTIIKARACALEQNYREHSIV